MSLTQDIKNEISNIKGPEPIYTNLKTAGPDIKFLIKGDSEEHKHNLKCLISRHSNIFFNLETKKYEVEYSENVEKNVRLNIKKDILDWISNGVISPNPKLTKQYRWFASQDTVTDGMYVLWKYMNQVPGLFYRRIFSKLYENIHYHNILCLIEFIRLKGE